MVITDLARAPSRARHIDGLPPGSDDAITEIIPFDEYGDLDVLGAGPEVTRYDDPYPNNRRGRLLDTGYFWNGLRTIRARQGALDPVHKDARTGIPDALLVVATGIFLVALAYARARGSSGFATPLFWTGQVLIFAFVAFRVLNQSTSPRDRECLVLLYAGAQSMIRWAYSPDMFTYSDELQHLRSLLNVLSTHHLFQANFSLPISPRYPGMENVAAEVAQVSLAGAFVAGVIVAGVSHLLLAACVLLLFREVSQSSRLACIGVLIYLLNPNAQYFNTSFHYETVALPFLVLSIFFSIRFAVGQRSCYQSFAGMLACLAIVAMTHHVSALATVGLLATIALGTSLFRGSRNLALPLALCAVLGALVVGCWMFFVAPLTGDYFSGTTQQLLNGLGKLGQVEGKSALTHSTAPIIDRVFSPAGVALTLILLAVSGWFARSRPPLERSFIWLASGSYAVVICIRLLVPNGAELSTRVLTYVSLFTALAVAVVLDRLASPARRPHRRPVRISGGLVSATALAMVLLLGSITTGIPEWWERLPGSFRVDGLASGIDAVGTSRAEWAATTLQPGSRYFGDITSVTLLATLARLDPIRAPGLLYYTDRLTPEGSALIEAQSATYVDVDMRMSQEVPITGNYFPVDIKAGNHETPLDIRNLRKFDNIPGISRIYDSGDDHLYDLRGVKGSPYGD